MRRSLVYVIRNHLAYWSLIYFPSQTAAWGGWLPSQCTLLYFY